MAKKELNTQIKMEVRVGVKANSYYFFRMKNTPYNGVYVLKTFREVYYGKD